MFRPPSNQGDAVSDQIVIELGLPPWRPAEDTEVVQTLNFYEVPLIGVIRQGGMDHLFACLEGHVERVSVWAYTRVDEEDLAGFEGSTDPLTAVMEVFGSRPVVVALAREGEGIVATELVRDPKGHQHLVEAALAANKELTDELAELLDTS